MTFFFNHAFWILLIVLTLIFGAGVFILLWGDKVLARRADKGKKPMETYR